jgi:hypothetical protein
MKCQNVLLLRVDNELVLLLLLLVAAVLITLGLPSMLLVAAVALLEVVLLPILLLLLLLLPRENNTDAPRPLLMIQSVAAAVAMMALSGFSSDHKLKKADADEPCLPVSMARKGMLLV